MRQIVQAFSLGMLTATSIFAIVFYISIEETTQPKTDESIQTKINYLESIGYVVEWPNAVNEHNQDPEETESPKRSPEQETIVYTLIIEPGMTSDEVGSILLETKIISDAKAFNDFLDDYNLHSSIQIGEYQLTSDMSVQQIVETITNG
ncbi:hypothetical protein [Aquibacillus salsiterrae]|uniref:Endolytic transglycosylase MltG n=1 Tax=Aquibacillus salsiterrae TaxID=2950439 RepID=A0A9X4ADP9_9BACI|nr:hypothetical protein [Aquibacillus salsiterrae]MDC3415524.1 hypothetical protein [Aquibacillus salsiterrae]